MIVSIYVPAWDQGINHFLPIVKPCLKQLSDELTGDYGGLVDHLAIELELSPLEADRRPPWRFRFQKKVAPSPLLRRFDREHLHNVGHYGVRPNHFELAEVPLEEVNCYLMNLIYNSTTVLAGQRRRIGDFDVERFRSRFRQILQDQGCARSAV